MLNNEILKEIASNTKNLKYLASKNTLSYDEFMKLSCTEEYQKRINSALNGLKIRDKENWH